MDKIIVFLVLVTAFLSEPIQAQDKTSEFIQSVIPVVAYIEDSLQAQVVHFGSGDLHQKTSVYQYLKSGKKKGICVFLPIGSTIEFTVSVAVANKKKWQQIATKKSESNVLFLFFESPESTNYKIDILCPILLEPEKYCVIVFE